MQLFMCDKTSLFKVLGQWGRSKTWAGDGWGLGEKTSPFPYPDPARRPPAFSIAPTDREPETGYDETCFSREVSFSCNTFISNDTTSS